MGNIDLPGEELLLTTLRTLTGLDVAANEIIDLRIQNLLLTRRLEVVSILAVGADVVETSESAVKKIGIICPPDLGQPDARWPEIPFAWLPKVDISNPDM